MKPYQQKLVVAALCPLATVALAVAVVVAGIAVLCWLPWADFERKGNVVEFRKRA